MNHAPPPPPKIALDAARTVPPYEQIRQQISDIIAAGVLVPGTRLPPVRQLARDLDLATGTVARAYSELEAAGLVVTRRGGGTTVATLTELTPARRAALLAAQADEFVKTARRLGASKDEIAAVVRAAIDEY